MYNGVQKRWEMQSNISKLATSPPLPPRNFCKLVEITFELFLAFLQDVPVYWVLMIKLGAFCEILEAHWVSREG